MAVIRRVPIRQESEEDGGGKKKWIAVLLAALLFAVLAAAAFSLRIQTITYVGNTHYSDEEMTALLYPGLKERLLVYDLFRDRFGEKENIPFIERVEKHYSGTSAVEVIVYEKSITGCIHYMGSYMFFDKDGMIVESSGEMIQGIPVIQGLSFQKIVLYQKLPVRNEDVFEGILNLTQLISLYHIPVATIRFDAYRNASLELCDGTGQNGESLLLEGITVELGSSSDMEEKVAELKNQIPYITGLDGTLHLETYDRNKANPSYIFETS